MQDLLFVNSPFIRNEHLDEEEKEFFSVYFEETKNMLTDEELSQYEKYLSKSINLSGGVCIPVYDLPDLPLWISSLSPIAKEMGYSPNVLDLAYLSFLDGGLEKIPSALKGVSGDIFLYSPFTNNQHVVENIATHIKRLNPDAINIVGGHHASFVDDMILRKDFDMVVRGEGEATFAELLSILDKSNYDLSKINGITYKNGAQIVANPDRKLIENLDSLPLQDYDILPEMYKGGFFGRIFSSRGCGRKCSFCAEALWSNNPPRYKSPERVLEEIDLMKDKLDVAYLFINDETFTSRMDHVIAISDVIETAGLSWSCQTRADFINKNMLNIMKDSGCHGIFFGAESADQNVLDLNNKQLNVREIQKACSLAKSVEMHVCTNWLVGLAGESEQSAMKTIEYAETLLLKGLTDRVDYYICVPYPGTDLYRRPEHYKLKINTSDFSKFREDKESVMDTEHLDAASIFTLWKLGLKRFTSAMKSRKNKCA